MKVLIAVDKFKGSLSAAAAGYAIRNGVLARYPGSNIEVLPLADGGEGFSDLMEGHAGGKHIALKVRDPLFVYIDSGYTLSGDGLTAYIESAKASGLQLLTPIKRDPLFTTTTGTGDLIVDALKRGAKTIALGIGGTATNDAGTGMAVALGYRFLDKDKEPLQGTGEHLHRIDRIVRQTSNSLIEKIEFIALCDVDNPLYGPHGAAYTYGPQKGANDHALKLLDIGLRNFERVVKRDLGVDADFPGAGAGGGLASGAKVFLNAKIRRGMDYVMEATGLEQKIREADLIITGEGKIDTQTLAGKVVGTVAATARRSGKTTIAVCGVCELRKIEIQKMGLSKVVSLVDPFTSEEEAIRNAAALITMRISEVV